MRAVASIEIRGAPRLSQLHALQLAKRIAARKISGILVKGTARVEMHIGRRGLNKDLLADWQADQAHKLVHDRKQWDEIYRAKLYQ